MKSFINIIYLCTLISFIKSRFLGIVLSKLFIASISLIYGIDFESLVIDNSFYSLLGFPFQKTVLEYIDSVIDASASKDTITIYFDEFLKHLKEPSNLERKRIKTEIDELGPNVYYI